MNKKKYSDASLKVYHAQEILYESEEVISSLKDVETGTRGYILTGNEIFLGPYNRANPKVMHHINQLKADVADDAQLTMYVDSITFYAEKRMDNALRSIVLRRSKEFTSWDTSLVIEGKIYMDRIRFFIGELKLAEEKKLTDYKHTSEKSLITPDYYYLLAAALIACMTIAFFYVRRMIKVTLLSEKEYRELLDSAPDAIIVVNEKGIIEIVNKQTEKIFGYKRNELIGNAIEILIPGEYHGRHIKHRANYFKDPNARPMGVNLELFGRRKDDTNFPVEISLSPLKTAHGLVISAAIRDITEKKKVQEELRTLNAELEKKVLERTAEIADYKYALDESCIVAITDQKGIIRYANKNFCRISKYSEEELIGQDHRIINSGYHSREFIRNLWTTIAGGNIWRGELKNKAKDGTDYWVDTTIVPFLNHQGKPYQYVAIRSDITRKKQVEEELHQLNSELEMIVRQRTQQLEQVNEELEAFTYSVSHDLRAPLRIIDGYGDILVTDYDTVLDDEAKRLVGVIMKNARHMGYLIDDLLNLSRLSRKELTSNVTDMNSLVKDVIQEEGYLRSGKIKIIAGDLEPASCDAGLLKQVWVNLISNSVKYSSTKPESVIEIGSFRGENETIYMVKDNGVGFNMNYSGKLFGVFQRLHKMSEYPGTGVGLAIVKRIVLKHGGRVWANAEQDKGATFYFSIPFQNLTN